MIAERLARSAVPDIANLLCRPGSSPLNHEDYACLLRCYLRQMNKLSAMLVLCGARYLADLVRELLPCGVTLQNWPFGAALPLLPPVRVTPPLPLLFLAQGLHESAIFVAHTDRETGQARLEVIGEVAYFELLERHGIAPAVALRLVHDTLYTAAVAETPDRVEPFARQLEDIGAQLGRVFTQKVLPW